MSVEVVMPQMGESITEGTVSKWLKGVGDRIEKDEAILEISTDKVDAEVPSPGAGVLLEIRHPEGETVEVGTVLAVIGAEGEQPAAGITQQSAPSPQSMQAQAVAKTATVSAGSSPGDAAVPQVDDSANSVNQELGNSGTSSDIVMPQMGESIT